MVVFNFSDLNQNCPTWAIWSEKSKLPVYPEIWYLDEFEYAEFNGAVNSFCFWLERPYLGKFNSEKLKLLV